MTDTTTSSDPGGAPPTGPSTGVMESHEHLAGAGVIKPGYAPRLTNEDLAPLKKQTWGSYNFFAFWMSDVHSVGGYVTAGSLFALGLAAWQVLIALLVGITIVYFLCNLVARPSQATGTPYPVASRISFGVLGANIPAIIRGLIAVAWYGIQTYLASVALVLLAIKLWPGLAPWAEVAQHGFAGSLDPGLDRVRDHVDRAGDRVLAGDGVDPQVHRLLWSRGVCGDVPARRLPGDRGRLGEHRFQPRRGWDHADRVGGAAGAAVGDRVGGVVLLRSDAELR